MRWFGLKKYCEIVEDLLPLYADNELHSETKKFVEEHLATCKECSLVVTDIRRTKATTVRLGAKSVTPTFKGDMDFALRLKKWRRNSALIGVAILLLLFVTLWLLLKGVLADSQQSDQNVLLMDYIGDMKDAAITAGHHSHYC